MPVKCLGCFSVFDSFLFFLPQSIKKPRKVVFTEYSTLNSAHCSVRIHCRNNYVYLKTKLTQFWLHKNISTVNKNVSLSYRSGGIFEYFWHEYLVFQKKFLYTICWLLFFFLHLSSIYSKESNKFMVCVVIQLVKQPPKRSRF